MPFIPHTPDDIEQMLEVIGVADINALFDEIPNHLRCPPLPMGAGLSEQAITRLMRGRAAEDGQPLNFVGAGAYEHHIPAAVWEITTRGEFYSAYTPYQAEASQGTLQLLYEFQSMMTRLTGLDVSNASLYDGASGLAEAVLMAVRGNRKSQSRLILLPKSLHPHYRTVVRTIVSQQGVTLQEIDFDPATGVTDLNALAAYAGQDIAALIIPQPNFFGGIEPVNAMVDWAQQQGAMAIAVVNPLTLSVLNAPGKWGSHGADIVCGEAQPLGIPLSSGGAYLGFLCCKQALVRQMPGRIIGRTVDLDGKTGYTLTLQAREQHIRRSKATSNICTNQGLMVTAATIYLSIMGDAGLACAAKQSYQNTHQLVRALLTLPGVKQPFAGSYFHEAVLQLPKPAASFLRSMGAHGIFAGVALEDWYSELQNCILVCATETKTQADLDLYLEHAGRILALSSKACQLQPKQL